MLRLTSHSFIYASDGHCHGVTLITVPTFPIHIRYLNTHLDNHKTHNNDNVNYKEPPPFVGQADWLKNTY